MTRQLDDAIEQVKALPEARQDEAAALLLDFVTQQATQVYLSPEQIAEIEARLSDNEPYATEEEVEGFFQRFRQ